MSAVRAVPDAAAAPNLIPAFFIPPNALLEGDPEERDLSHLTSGDHRFSIGVWSAQPYAEWVESHEGYEYARVLEGSITLTPVGGPGQTFTVGSAFTVEPGWRGEYRVDSPAVKQYVSYRP